MTTKNHNHHYQQNDKKKKKKKTKKKTKKKKEPSIYLSTVLFPCQHRCICNECWEATKQKENNKYRTCPLCYEEIKITFDYSYIPEEEEEEDDEDDHDSYNGYTTREEEKYWDWINEIKPPLPNGFVKSFVRNSRRAISEAMAKSIMDDYDDDHEKEEGEVKEDEDDEQVVDNGGNDCEKKKKKDDGGNMMTKEEGKEVHHVMNSNYESKKRPQYFHNKEVVNDSKVCIIS